MADEKRKPTLVLDFDGVIHSYSSPWAGPRRVLDPPVPGALRFVCQATAVFDVCVHSSRSHAIGGRRAMRRWLQAQYAGLDLQSPPRDRWWTDYVLAYDAGLPDLRACAREAAWWLCYHQVRWPLFKPAAFMTVDDRAVQFKGKFVDDPARLLRFKLWNRL